MNDIALKLPSALQAEVDRALGDWDRGGKMQRLWDRDPSLWTGQDEGKWLGWLDIVDPKAPVSAELISFIEGVRADGFQHAILLGMGGSSLCPEVMSLTFGPVPGAPRLHILDSTDPVQVQSVAAQAPPASTLFIVSSKSGSTLEPNIFFQYFWDVAVKAIGAEKAATRFVAITDPGSKMESVAREHRFRAIFHGRPSIGGRYSALSNFGMVPAGVLGVDLPRFLNSTLAMARACQGNVTASRNPGGILGAVLGTLGRSGRNKVTLITSPGIGDLGAWLEQLLAESTGKQGKGLIPVDRERLASPDRYGTDRLFAYLRLQPEPDRTQDAAVEALVKGGHPVVQIALADRYDLGQEFFRWEIATAVAGALLGINAFDQPDVEASKVATRALTEGYEKTGVLPEERPFLEDGPALLFADEANAAPLRGGKSLGEALRAHLGRLGAADYFGLLAYLPMTSQNEALLQEARHAVRDRKRVATCLGFGPRFLHSTGQAYKGGPNSGVFLQVTCDDPVQLPVPGQKYTFGIVKAAQARGDFQVLAERKRRALRLHLRGELERGLKLLRDAVTQAT